MPNTGHYWRPREIENLRQAFLRENLSSTVSEFCRNWGKQYGFGMEAARAQLNRLKNEGKLGKDYIPESTYPVYDLPLEMVGDALIMGDMELPYHNARFINQCLELAQKWEIKQAILAGDVLHFDSLSHFNPNWAKESTGGLTAGAEKKLMDLTMTLPKNQQQKVIDTIVEIGEIEQKDGISDELRIARNVLGQLEKQFERIDYVLGNHDSRLLNTLQTVMFPSELLKLLCLEEPRWRISPFYFSILKSGGQTYQIEHPRNAAKGMARKLASKYHQHILAFHSHHFALNTDPSGEYLCAEVGCCVDEARLPYCAQRHNTSDQHLLGAAIVRDGYLWLLNKFTDWGRIMNL